MFVPRIDDAQRTCLTCFWFQFPNQAQYDQAKAEGKPPPLRNRGCAYDGAIAFERMSCKMWKSCFTRWQRLKARFGARLPRRSIVR